MNLNQLTQEIANEIEAAECLMSEIDNAQQKLSEAGMYEAIPRVEWQSRNDKNANYMYLVFIQDKYGNYPNGKRKIYIGANYKKQAQAAKMIDRRQRWERLDTKANELSRWISRKEADLQRIKEQLQALHNDRQSWQKFNIEEKEKTA